MRDDLSGLRHCEHGVERLRLRHFAGNFGQRRLELPPRGRIDLSGITGAARGVQRARDRVVRRETDQLSRSFSG
jgi:hypothetical protein